MTRTTAKKGMVEYKKGHAKEDFDFGYLSTINYDDNRELKEVVETLFSKNKSLEKQIDVLTTALNEKVDMEVKKLQDKMDQFDRVFEKNIKEWLTR